MSFLPYPPTSTTAAIEVFRQDVAITHEVVHGSDTATVLTEGGEIPTINKLIKDLNDRIGAGTGADITLRPDLADEDSNVPIAGKPASAISGAVISLTTRNGLLATQEWTAGESVDVGDCRVYRGVTWEPNSSSKICGISPSFNDFHIVSTDGKLWPDNFGASYLPEVDQSPAINRMEAFAKLTNQPTYYRPVLHYLLTPVVLSREPNMNGTGGGQSSIRNRKLNPARRYVGTVFYSKVVGDYALKINLPSYHFGGRIENITLVGRIDPLQPKTVGHGAIFGGWGWSAQVNNLSIEGFKGKNLTLNYMQDTAFNSLTLLDGSNGPLEPMLEFAAESNFIYFNNPHFEEFEYLLRVKGGTNAPWEVKFLNGHFEAGNYTNGTAASAPDPSLERRYTSSPIYSAEFVRDWTFDNCFFVPVSARALAADSDGIISNKPHFIRLEDSEGVSFSGKTRVQAQGACDFAFLGSSGTIDYFGRNTIHDLTIINANPTKYSVSTNNTDILKIEMLFDPFPSAGLYGINIDNGCICDSRFRLRDSAFTRTEGFLINTTTVGSVRVGKFGYDLSVNPFRFVNKNCTLEHEGSRQFLLPMNASTGVLDLETLPPDAQFYANNEFPTVITDVINGMNGKRLIFTNRLSGNLTVTATPNIRLAGGTRVMGQHEALETYCDAAVFRQIS